MPRPPKPPTLWDRSRRYVVGALLVVGIVAVILGSVAVGGILAFIALGLATFSGGGPKGGDGTYESGKGFAGGRFPMGS